MTIYVIEGFEGVTTPNGWSTSASSGTALLSQSTSGRAGGAAMRAQRLTGNTFGASAGVNIPVGASLPSGCFGFGCKRITNAVTAGNGIALLRIREGSTIHLDVVQNADGTLSVRRGGTTVLCTSTATMLDTSWNYVELEFSINDSTGYVKLYLNGDATPIAQASGVDTRNGGTSGICDTVYYGFRSSVNGTNVWDFDDVYVSDTTALGDCVVDMLRPAGPGASTQWTPSSAVANWTTVDDSSAADYVGTAGGSGQKDLYTTAHLATGLGTVVHATQTEVYALKSDVGTPPGPINLVRRSVGGTETSEAVAPPASLTTAQQTFLGSIRHSDPNGDPWTLTRLDGMQIGVSVP